jgi:GNAT superfamily N-acetyltransferase
MNKKVRAPAGYSFRITNGINQWDKSIYINLVYNKTKQIVGKVTLCPSYLRSKAYETHSYLDDGWRNKGLGGIMYARAIQYCLENGYKVRSSGGSSEAAQRVWNGKVIRKYFLIRKRKDKYYPDSDTCAIWYAYEKNL